MHSQILCSIYLQLPGLYLLYPCWNHTVINQIFYKPDTLGFLANKKDQSYDPKYAYQEVSERIQNEAKKCAINQAA